MTQIRLAGPKDIPELFNHVIRHANESGLNGSIIYSPLEGPPNRTIEQFSKEKTEKWSREITTIGWERCWLLTDREKTVGNIALVHQPELESSLHRSVLMMGIENGYRGKGFGTLLMEKANQWAKEQPSLAWIDLFVFEENSSARRLYGKFQFKEIGITPDYFRVFGKSINDIHMTLRINDNL